MIIVKIRKGYNEIPLETERYSDAELLISTILSLADKRITVEIATTDETEASRLQDEVAELETRLARAMTKLQKYEGKVEGE